MNQLHIHVAEINVYIKITVDIITCISPHMYMYMFGALKDSRAFCGAFGSVMAVDFMSTALAKEPLSGFFFNFTVLYTGWGQLQ